MVIDFTAPGWCVPCQRFAPHFEKAAAALDNITFVAVDVDKTDGWPTEEYGVRGVPAVVQFVKGSDTVRNIESRAVVPLIKELES